MDLKPGFKGTLHFFIILMSANFQLRSVNGCVPLAPVQSPGKTMFMLLFTPSFLNDTFNYDGLWMLEQIKYALDELVSPPWNQFGYVFYDTCNDPQQVVNVLTRFAELLSSQIEGVSDAKARESLPVLPPGESVLCPCQLIHTRRIVAVLGDFSDSLAQIISYALARVDVSITIVNRRLTGEALENKDEYPNYFTFVNTYKFKARLIRSLLIRENWSYVGVLHGESSDYLEQRRNLNEELVNDSVCIFRQPISPARDAIVKVLKLLQGDRFMNVFVLFCDDATTLKILEAAAMLNMTGKIWIVTGGDVYLKYLERLPKFITDGIIRIAVNADFGYPLERFLNLSYNDGKSNQYLKRFFEYHNATNENARVRDFQDFFNFNDVGAVNIMSIIQKFIDDIKKRSFVELNKMIQRNYLILEAARKFFAEGKRSKSFDFQSFSLWRYNSFRFIRFADWNSDSDTLSIVESIDWFDASHPPGSRCDAPCQPGFYSIPYDRAGCCRVCLPCSEGKYKSSTGYEECGLCAGESIPSANRSTCSHFRLDYQSYHEPSSYALYCLVLCSLSFIAFIAVTFWRYKSTPVVMSSDRRTSVIQLTCMFVLFCSVLLFFGQPSPYLCVGQVLVPGSMLTLFIGLTLVKTERLLRIFQMQVRITNEERNITATIATSIIIAIVSIFSILMIAVFLKWPPQVDKRVDRGALIKELTCNTNIATLFESAYIALVSSVCMIEALRARKLPENYSETKFIFLSMFLVLLLQLVHIPVLMSSDNPRRRTLLECVITVLNGLCLTATLYGYKVLIILFRPQMNNAEVFRKQVREANLRIIKNDLQNIGVKAKMQVK